MKKILCLAFALGVFSSGEAYAVVSALQDSYANFQQREVIDTIGGGGGGTTIYQKPVTDIVDTGPVVVTEPKVPVTPPLLKDGTDSGALISGWGETAITATVSSCPSGTTMSADKCCCVNN